MSKRPNVTFSILDRDRFDPVNHILQNKVIAQFDHESTPYRALRRRRFQAAYTYDDYAHLARFGEWGADSDGDGA